MAPIWSKSPIIYVAILMQCTSTSVVDGCAESLLYVLHFAVNSFQMMTVTVEKYLHCIVVSVKYVCILCKLYHIEFVTT